jgi:hypothetical protein
MMQQFNRKGSIGLTATDVGGCFDARRDLVYCQRPLVCLDTPTLTFSVRVCSKERSYAAPPTRSFPLQRGSLSIILDHTTPPHIPPPTPRTWRRENYVTSAPKTEPGGNRDSLEHNMRRDVTKERRSV